MENVNNTQIKICCSYNVHDSKVHRSSLSINNRRLYLPTMQQHVPLLDPWMRSWIDWPVWKCQISERDEQSYNMTSHW